MPEIDNTHPTRTVEEQQEYYRRKGIVFLDDEWSLWHIRVWVYSREVSGVGTSINADIVFRYAHRWGMGDIETLERVKHIERGVE